MYVASRSNEGYWSRGLVTSFIEDTVVSVNYIDFGDYQVLIS